MQGNSDNKENLKEVRYILGIVAGKGGVGKSTIASQLAQIFQKKGLKVGVLDADIYGPSQRELLSEEILPQVKGNQVVPAQASGISLMSVAYFNKGQEASVIRAPIANQITLQFIQEVDWGDLDLLIIDFPPGTGDVQLTLMQNVPFTGIVVVTTPQDLSLLDVRKSAQMCQQMGMPVMGVIENMSYYVDPTSNEKHRLFGEGGGKTLADEFHIPLLTQVPIDPSLQKGKREGSDKALEEGAEKILSDLKDEKVREINKEDRYHFSIKWLDGKESLYRSCDVQRLCPCVKCSQNRETLKVDPHAEVEQIARVGRFGLQLQFTKGCSQGIYSFSLLREMDR